MKVKDQTQLLKVLVADKSSYGRLVLEDILSVQEDLKLVGLAADGDELLMHMKATAPDVVLLDYHLPKNSRLFTVKRIFGEMPTPVLLLIDKEYLTLELVKMATEIGVYGIVVKPKGANYRSIAEEVLLKIRAVRQSEYWDASARLHMLQLELSDTLIRTARSKPVSAETLVVIGASTGGTQAIETIIKELPAELQACILVAVHLPSRFTKSFSKRLQTVTPLLVAEGRSGHSLKHGEIIIAPGGRNMVVEPATGKKSSLKIGFTDETVSFDQPSVDLLMKSVAGSMVTNVIGVILTGMGKDGTMGAACLKSIEGVVIAQDEESSVIFGMAKSAIDSGLIDAVLPLSEIAQFINAYAETRCEVSLTDSIT